MSTKRRSSAEIAADITRTRAELGQTLDALEHKLSPRQFMEQGLDMLRDTFTGKNGVGETIARNPIPLALIGVGLGWLLWTSTGARESRGTAVKRRLKDAKKSAETLVEATADSLVEKPADPLAPVREAGEHASDLMRKYPLAVGGVVALAGALLAISLPSTRPEDELLGATRDALRDRALDSGRDALARVEEAAGRAASAALETVVEEGDASVAVAD